MTSPMGNAVLLCVVAGALSACASREPCGRAWKGRASHEQESTLRALGRDALALEGLADLWQLKGAPSRVNGIEVYDPDRVAGLERLNRYSRTRRVDDGIEFRFHPVDTTGMHFVFPDLLFARLGISRSQAESLARRMARAGVGDLERRPGAVIMSCTGGFDGVYGLLYEPGESGAGTDPMGRAYRGRPVGRDLYAWGTP